MSNEVWYEAFLFVAIFVCGVIFGAVTLNNHNDSQQKNHCESTIHNGRWVDYGTKEFCFDRDRNQIIYEITE